MSGRARARPRWRSDTDSEHEYDQVAPRRKKVHRVERHSSPPSSSSPADRDETEFPIGHLPDTFISLLFHHMKADLKLLYTLRRVCRSMRAACERNERAQGFGRPETLHIHFRVRNVLCKEELIGSAECLSAGDFSVCSEMEVAFAGQRCVDTGDFDRDDGYTAKIDGALVRLAARLGARVTAARFVGRARVFHTFPHNGQPFEVHLPFVDRVLPFLHSLLARMPQLRTLTLENARFLADEKYATCPRITAPLDVTIKQQAEHIGRQVEWLRCCSSIVHLRFEHSPEKELLLRQSHEMRVAAKTMKQYGMRVPEISLNLLCRTRLPHVPLMSAMCDRVNVKLSMAHPLGTTTAQWDSRNHYYRPFILRSFAYLKDVKNIGIFYIPNVPLEQQHDVDFYMGLFESFRVERVVLGQRVHSVSVDNRGKTAGDVRGERALFRQLLERLGAETDERCRHTHTF